MKQEIVLGILLAGALLAPGGADARLLEVPHRYPTITQACQAAYPGDTVAVYPGTYSECVMPVRAGVTVLGMGSDSTDVRVCAPLGSPAFGVGLSRLILSMKTMPGTPFFQATVLADSVGPAK